MPSNEPVPGRYRHFKGGEYEVINNGRLGASYTRRYMNSVIEDMSRDEANTYFIGNPGYGISKDFPKAKRNYDAVTVYLQRSPITVPA